MKDSSSLLLLHMAPTDGYHNTLLIESSLSHAKSSQINTNISRCLAKYSYRNLFLGYNGRTAEVISAETDCINEGKKSVVSVPYSRNCTIQSQNL
jgi:hypothetical protein